MDRATLVTFQSTPLGIVVAESGLAAVRVLLDHRQARFTQRDLSRPKELGPDEILDRRGSSLTDRLRAATLLQTGETPERQQGGI